jgi:hypothetical protein
MFAHLFSRHSSHSLSLAVVCRFRRRVSVFVSFALVISPSFTSLRVFAALIADFLSFSVSETPRVRVNPLVVLWRSCARTYVLAALSC